MTQGFDWITSRRIRCIPPDVQSQRGESRHVNVPLSNLKTVSIHVFWLGSVSSMLISAQWTTGLRLFRLSRIPPQDSKYARYDRLAHNHSAPPYRIVNECVFRGG